MRSTLLLVLLSACAPASPDGASVLHIARTFAPGESLALPSPSPARHGMLEVSSDGDVCRFHIGPDASVSLVESFGACSDTERPAALCLVDGGSAPVLINHLLYGPKWLLGSYEWQ